MTLSDEEVKQIFQLRKEGKSLREIERLTGVPKTKVGETLKNENTVLESFKIKNYCIWGSECEKICTDKCKSYYNAVCNKKASDRLLAYMDERKKLMEKKMKYYHQKYRSSLHDQEESEM